MKRLGIVLLLALIANVSMAQSSAVASAYNYLKNGQPQKAVPEIERASKHESTMNDAKTWYYKGNIYLQLYTFAHMTDGITKGATAKEVEMRLGKAESKRNFRKLEEGERWIYPYDFTIYMSKGVVDHYEFDDEAEYKAAATGDVLAIAREAYKKSKELDAKFIKFDLSPATADLGIQQIGRFYYNAGIEKYNLKTGDIAKNREDAFESFENANSVKKDLNEVDTNYVLYAGYVAGHRNDTANVIKYYTILVDSGTYNLAVYVGLTNIYLNQKNIDKALEVVKKGRTILPTKQDLLLTEANIYLQSDRAEDAERILLQAAAADPNNADLQFAIGANYDKIINDSTYTDEQRAEAMRKGKAALKKAIEINPNHFSALYNMGAMLNNKASTMLIEARNLPLDETTKYDALTKEALELLMEAKPYLEKCHTLKPKDNNTMIMLKGIYSQTKDYDNLKKIKAEMEAL